jgi:MFS family permease
MGTTKPRVIFTLAVLLGINTMNFYDRQVQAAVQEQLKTSWDAPDRILGYLGSAFIILYAVVGLPFGRLADVGNRKLILAGGVAVWSVLTFGSGLAWSFMALFILRLGVGVGEATCAPASNSLIGDLVRPEGRSRALSVFMIGLPLGLALGSLISGVIAKHYSWQAAFYVAAVPGLLLAVAALFITEPPRGAADVHAPVRRDKQSVPVQVGGDEAARLDAHAPVRRDKPSVLTVASIVLSLPTIWLVIVSGALHNFNMYALGGWLASLLQRYHSVGPDKAGWIMGIVQGAGILPLFLVGWLGDRAFRRGVSGRLHVAWIAMAPTVPSLFLMLAAPPGEVWQCAAWLLPSYALLFAYYGTVYATIQDIIEPHLRGLAMAIYFFAMYLLGGVLGPLVPGLLSDRIALQLAEAAGVSAPTALHRATGLHDALYLVPVLDGILVLVLIAASLTVKRDYLRRRQREEAAARAAAPVPPGAIMTAPVGGPVGIMLPDQDGLPGGETGIRR